MQLARIFILIILVLGSTSVAAAAEIIVPNGVTLLTEEQLLDRVIGNTFIGGKRWVEYYEPGIDGVKQGKIKGYSKDDGLHGGTWSISGPLMCWEFDVAKYAVYNGCWTTAIDGDSVIWYSSSGTIHTDPAGHITLVPGNPNNL